MRQAKTAFPVDDSTFCSGFPPSIAPDCTHLILGSMPSRASLAAQQYYAHPQNRFWPLMAFLLTGAEAPPAKYEDRLRMLLEHHIALWDAIETCERHGSLDADIKKETGTDIPALLATYPGIRTICFNGGKAFQSFRKCHRELLAQSDIRFCPLPSTSPANARWSMEMLRREWGKALDDRTR